MTAILKSPRFIAVLIIGGLQTLVLFNFITSEQGEGLIRIIQGILGSAVVVRTLDRQGDKAVLAASIGQ